MKAIYIVSLFCVLSMSLLAQDDELSAEIARWKCGTELPHKLLHFPDGKIELPNFVCGIAAYSKSVAPYIDRIDNDELLVALLFDYRTDIETFQLALRRLLRLKGPSKVAELLTEIRQRKEEQTAKSELAALRQILQSPFSRLKVAFIESKDMPRERALQSMASFKKNLEKGMSWKAALSLVAEHNPDVDRRKREPKVPTTLVCYLYDSWISEIGFDLVTFGMADRIPIKHLPALFVKGVGVYVVDDESGVYIYSVENLYNPRQPNNAADRVDAAVTPAASVAHY